MSDLSHLGLVEYILGQSSIVSLLATQGGDPAVFPSRRNTTPDVFPQLIILETDGGPESDEGYSSKMVHEWFSIQVWDDSRDPVRMKRIARKVGEKLHEGRFPMDDVVVHYIERVQGGQAEGYDVNTKTHFIIQSYHLCYTPEEET